MEKLPLIVLHGALGSASQMQPLTDLLASHLEVHAFDLTGHGKSVLNHTFSMELFTGDLLDYMESHNIQRADVFGYSMGGYIALHAATGHSEKFRKLITLGTQFQWTVSSAIKEAGMLKPEVIEKKVPAFARLLENRHTGTDWRCNMWKTALLMLHLGYHQPLNEKTLKSIKNDVLIMWGDQDRMVSAQSSQEAAGYLQHGEFLEIENTPHPFEQVDSRTIAGKILACLEIPPY